MLCSAGDLGWKAAGEEQKAANAVILPPDSFAPGTNLPAEQKVIAAFKTALIPQWLRGLVGADEKAELKAAPRADTAAEAPASKLLPVASTTSVAAPKLEDAEI